MRINTLIIDNEDVLLVAATGTITILPDSDVIGTIEFKLAFHFEVELGFWYIMIKGDSLNVVRNINAYFLNNYYMGSSTLLQFTLFIYFICSGSCEKNN